MEKRIIFPLIAIILVVIILIVVFLYKGGYINLFGTNEESSINKYQTITVAELRDLLEGDQKLVLLDVREPHEYNESKIEGSILIPLGQLESNLDKLNKEDKIIVICRSGSRSSQASQILANNGFKDVYNMSGGMLEWARK